MSAAKDKDKNRIIFYSLICILALSYYMERDVDHGGEVSLHQSIIVRPEYTNYKACRTKAVTDFQVVSKSQAHFDMAKEVGRANIADCTSTLLSLISEINKNEAARRYAESFIQQERDILSALASYYKGDSYVSVRSWRAIRDAKNLGEVSDPQVKKPMTFVSIVIFLVFVLMSREKKKASFRLNPFKKKDGET